MAEASTKKILKPLKNFPTDEYINPGHRACQGCAEVLAVRHVLKAIGPDVIMAMATGCMEIISSPYPLTSWNIPWIHVAFENAAAVASGIESGLKVLRRKGRSPRSVCHDSGHGGRRRDCRHRIPGPFGNDGAWAQGNICVRR